MKNIIINKIKDLYVLVLPLVFFACDSDFDKDDGAPNTAPPQVTSISEVREDVVVTQGVLDATYIIRGENLSSMVSVSFNGQQAGFNPALLTDNIAFVKIPGDTPFLDQSNVLRVETLGGSVDVDFPLLHITGFTEETLDGQKVVHLAGAGFNFSPTVTFVSGSEALGNLVERTSEVLAVNDKVITATVPDGVIQAFIFVETSRGAITQSASYGFTLAGYLDALNPDFSIESWGGDEDYSSTEQALGTSSIKKTYDQWGGVKWRLSDPLSTQQFSTMVLKVYGGANASKLRISFNDLNNDNIGIVLDVVEGEWNSYSLSLRDENFWNGAAQAEISVIVIQELSGVAAPEYVYYLDDLGFL